MTNITPATHKGLSELILNNIETYKRTKGNEEALIAFRANLETLKQIYGEYTNKIKEVRELVELYNQVQHCVKTNFRSAKNRKKGAAPLIKTKVLFSNSRHTGNVLEITEARITTKKKPLVKLAPAAAGGQ